MKIKPIHGNRLRPPDEAYEVKKQRSRDRYAETQLKANPYWLHNKIIRELVYLHGTNTDIPVSEFSKRNFDANKYKSIEKRDGLNYLFYDKYYLTITKQNNVIIWKL